MKTHLLASSAALGFLCSSAFGSTFALNMGPTISDAEAGFTLASSPNSTGGAAVNQALGTHDGVVVAATTGGHASDNRYRSVDRGDSTQYSGALDQLTESWIGTQTQGSALTITLGGISAGAHSWTSYHFDNGTGSGGSGNQNGKMLIELSLDSGTTFSTVDPSFQIQDNEGTVTSTLVPFATNFNAVAGQSVHFRFTNNAFGTLASGTPDGGQDFTVLNGFSVAPIPEPSAGILAGLGLLGLLRRRR